MKKDKNKCMFCVHARIIEGASQYRKWYCEDRYRVLYDNCKCATSDDYCLGWTRRDSPILIEYIEDPKWDRVEQMRYRKPRTIC